MEKNIIWQKTSITTEDHERLNGHSGFCLWFTGLSGAGKSTISNLVEQRLYEMGVHTYLLDGDNIRHGLNGDLGFSPTDRSENIRRVSHVAGLFVDAGMVAITAMISPFRDDRDRARRVFPPSKFVEVYVKCSVEVCAERDPKGLYEKALAGMIKNFTGVSSPYEAPESPEITLDTTIQSVEHCVDEVLGFISERHLIKASGVLL